MEELYIEAATHNIPEDAVVHKLQLQAQSNFRIAFEKRDCLGGAMVSAGQQTLLWEIHAQTPWRLVVAILGSSHRTLCTAHAFDFACELYPEALVVGDEDPAVITLTADGTLHGLQLRSVGVDWVGQCEITSITIQEQLSSLGDVSRLTCAGDFAILGGSSGHMLCLPLTSLHQGSAEKCFVLQESKSILSGLFARSVVASPVVDIASIDFSGTIILAAIHADNNIVVWDLQYRKKLLSGFLLENEALRMQLTPKKLNLTAEDSGPGLLGLVTLQPSNPFDRITTETAFLAIRKKPKGGDLELKLFGMSLEVVKEPCQDSSLSPLPGWGNIACILSQGVEQSVTTLQDDGGEGPQIILSKQMSQDLDLIVQAQLWRGFTQSAAVGLSDAAVLTRAFSKLFDPLTVSYPALARVLEDLGKQVAPDHLKRQPSPQVLDFLVQAALDWEGWTSVIEVVSLVMQSYHSAWKATNMAHKMAVFPLSAHKTGMISSANPPSPDLDSAVLLLRSGLRISELRPAVLSQAITSGILPVFDVNEDVGDLTRLSKVVSMVTQLLGDSILHTVEAFMWQGSDFYNELAPYLVSAIQGNGKGHGQQSPSERRILRAWAQGRREHLAQLAQELARIQDLPAALVSLVDSLSQPASLDGPLPSQRQQSGILEAPVASANARVLQGVLLLLSLLEDQSQLGVFQCNLLQQFLAETDFSSEVEAALRLSLLVEWLQYTPCLGFTSSQPVLSPASHMRNLTTNGSPRYQRHPSKQAVKSLAVYLETTGESSKSAAPDFAASAIYFGSKTHSSWAESLHYQGLAISVTLFRQAEYDSLAQALQILNLDSSPALLLLKGLAEMGKHKGLFGAQSHTGNVSHAISLLDKSVAPSSFSSYEKSRSISEQDVEPSDQQNQLEKELITLLASLTSSEIAELDFSTIQDRNLFCNLSLMALSEQLGCAPAGAHFAGTAASLTNQIRQTAEPGLSGQLLQEEGMLWSKVFGYHLDAKQYEEAYQALEANPLGQDKLDCLQALLHAMCLEQALKTLISLPYSSLIVTRENGRLRRRSCQQAAIDILYKRAEIMELSAQPQPYEVLAAFLGSKNEWRGAAHANLLHARRLQEEKVANSSIASALSSAAGCLSIAPTDQQWLEDRSSESDSNEDMSNQTKKESIIQNAPSLSRLESCNAISLKELEDEAAAARMSARWLPEKLYKNPKTTVVDLHAAGIYEQAVKLAGIALQGTEKEQTIQKSLVSLADQTILKQIRQSSDGDSGWDALQRLTLKHKDLSNAPAIWQGIASAILKVEGMPLPSWLLDLFLAVGSGKGMSGGPGDPIGLVRLYLQNDRLQEAGDIVKDFLQQWLYTISDLDRQEFAGSFFPFALVSALTGKMKASQSAQDRQLGSSIEGMLQELIRLEQDQTAILEASQHRKPPANDLTSEFNFNPQRKIVFGS